MSFEASYKKLLPWWLTNGEGGKVPLSLARMLDTFRTRAKDALLARFPEYVPDEAALAALGRDRKIVRGIGEPAAAYAARLVRALDDHRVRGTPYALLAQLQAYLQARCVVRTVDRRGNWYSLDADGNPSKFERDWDWDGRPASPDWARFWVIIYPENGIKPWKPSPAWNDPTLWGDGLWGHPDKTIGTTATVDQVSSVKSIVRDWKPDGTRCEWIIIAFDPSSFPPPPAISIDPSGEWGDWSDHRGNPVRLDTARYWAVGANQ